MQLFGLCYCGAPTGHSCRKDGKDTASGEELWSSATNSTLSGHGPTRYPRDTTRTMLSYYSCSTEYIQSDTCPCLPNSSCLMPLELSVGILLTAWCSPPHPKLPANRKPVCSRQETDFCLRAGRVKRGKHRKLSWCSGILQDTTCH